MYFDSLARRTSFEESNLAVAADAEDERLCSELWAIRFREVLESKDYPWYPREGEEGRL